MTTIPVATTDYLEQDPPLRGQQYVCLSFISPEDVILKRDTFYFGRFMAAVGQDVANLFDGIEDQFKDDATTRETVRMLRQRYSYLTSPQDLDSEYKFFVDKRSVDLDKEFNEQVSFQTSIRGIKVRGVTESLPEAMKRVEVIKRFDDKHNVYVAEVGCWCPWSPNPDDVKDSVFAETQLNTLMKSYKDNLAVRDEYYTARKRGLVASISKQEPATWSSRGTVDVAEVVQVQVADADAAAAPSEGPDAAAASAPAPAPAVVEIENI